MHGAVLLGRFSAGSGTSSAAPQAPVLTTRIVMPAAAVASADEQAPVMPAPVPAELPKVAPAAPLAAAAATRGAEAQREERAPAPPASAVLPAPAAPPVALATAPPWPEAAAAPPPSTYLSSGLDPPPRPLGDIDPAVPAAAGSRGGVVVLRLSINERGGVDKAEVLDSSPPGLFDASAVEAFSAARFSPGYLAGVAVKSQVTFEVRYRALGSGSEAAGKTY
ncbi:MAG: energy transducer TonB [Caldimonas sp.]